MSNCAKFAELLSAYADAALCPEQHEWVSEHLACCDDCRAEVQAYRAVRRALRASSPDQGEPLDLAARLVSIAGEDADQPLYARPFDPVSCGSRGVRLPSRRRRARQTLAAAMTMIITGACGFIGIGWANAPLAEASVVDPLPEARVEFATAMGSLPLANNAVNAALLVDEHDAQRADATAPAAAEVTRAEGAYQWLQLAEHAAGEVPVSGTQIVQSRHRAGYWESSLQVVSEPGKGSLITGKGLSAGGWLPHEPTLGTDLIAANHALSAGEGPVVAGRASVMVQAVGQSGPVARWWIDRETGVLLWEQSLDLSGRTVVSAGYSTVQIGVSPPNSKRPTRLTGHASSSSLTVPSGTLMNGLGWDAKGRLAGLDLVRMRGNGGTMFHTVYSDGITTLSVVQQKGTLAQAPEGTIWDPAFQAYRSSGLPTALSWQSGDTVFTVLTDGPTDIATRAVGELPHHRPVSRSGTDRVLDGWQEVTRFAMGN